MLATVTTLGHRRQRISCHDEAVSDDVLPGAVQRLAAVTYIDYADCDVRYTTEPAPDELVSRLHLVAVTAHGDVVVSRSVQGWRFLPGGTREPGEALIELARRELIEEAGARLLAGIAPFSSFVSHSRTPAPYRPHLPHPRAYWLHAVAQVEVVGPPTSPADGEQITDVLQLPPREAVDYIAVHDPIHADVLAHAIALGLLPSSDPVRGRTSGPR